MTEPPTKTSGRRIGSDLSARGEPFVWIMGASLVAGLGMIIGLLCYVFFVGALTFWPASIETVSTVDGKTIAGEPFRSETFRVPAEALQALAPNAQNKISNNFGMDERTLYRVGNYDLYGEDFVWVPDFNKKAVTFDRGMYFVERLEWGPFVGRVKELNLSGKSMPAPSYDAIREQVQIADGRRRRIARIEKNDIGGINNSIEDLRLQARRAEIDFGIDSAEAKQKHAQAGAETLELKQRYGILEAQVAGLRQADEAFTITLASVDNQSKTLPISRLVRLYPANDLSVLQRLQVYLSRWVEFITTSPREANTEGGILPALAGTLTMMVLLSLAVAPFGVITALYLREYAKQGVLVSFIRICVNNLAGVP